MPDFFPTCSTRVRYGSPAPFKLSRYWLEHTGKVESSQPATVASDSALWSCILKMRKRVAFARARWHTSAVLLTLLLGINARAQPATHLEPIDQELNSCVSPCEAFATFETDGKWRGATHDRNGDAGKPQTFICIRCLGDSIDIQSPVTHVFTLPTGARDAMMLATAKGELVRIDMEKQPLRISSQSLMLSAPQEQRPFIRGITGLGDETVAVFDAQQLWEVAHDLSAATLHPLALSPLFITSVVASPEGGPIAVGTASGVLCLEKTDLRPTYLRSSPLRIRSLLIDESQLFAATATGSVSRTTWTTAGCNRIPPFESLPDPDREQADIVALATAHNYLYAAFSSGIVKRYALSTAAAATAGRRWEVVISHHELDGRALGFGVEAKSDRLWLSSGRGIEVFNLDGEPVARFPSETLSAVGGSRILRVDERHGLLWFGSHVGSISRLLETKVVAPIWYPAAPLGAAGLLLIVAVVGATRRYKS